jgi:uncharacterized membrane protein YedE/YeeE
LDAQSVLTTLASGALFGAAASALLFFNGRIAGISGITAQAIEPGTRERTGPIAFIAGLLAGGMLLTRIDPAAIAREHALSTPWLIAAGLLIGIGAKLGNGCTSGHGVCGVGRMSKRSIAAVTMFTFAGAVVHALVAALGGLS